MREVALRPELISLIQPPVLRQHSVLGQGLPYLRLNVLTAQFPSSLPVLALNQHPP